MTKEIKRLKDCTFVLNTSSNIYEKLDSEDGKRSELKDYINKICNEINAPGISLYSLKSSAINLIFYGQAPKWYSPGHFELYNNFNPYLSLSLDSDIHATIMKVCCSKSGLVEKNITLFDVTLKLKDEVKTVTLDLDWISNLATLKYLGMLWNDKNIDSRFKKFVPMTNEGCFARDTNEIMGIKLNFNIEDKYKEMMSMFGIRFIGELASLELVSINKVYLHDFSGSGFVSSLNFEEINNLKENHLEELSLIEFGDDKDTVLDLLTVEFKDLFNNSYSEFITAKLLIHSYDLNHTTGVVWRKSIIESNKEPEPNLEVAFRADTENLIWTYNSMYCKSCRKLGYIPQLGFESIDVICPNCGKLHRHEDAVDIFRNYYSNSKVFDHGEDERKVKIRHRILGYKVYSRNIVPLNLSLGFTVNLDTNRAYLHVKQRNKSTVRCIGGDVLEAFNPIIDASEGYSIDSNGDTVFKIKTIESTYNDLYEALSKYRDLRYSKDEILKYSNSLEEFFSFDPDLHDSEVWEEKNKVYAILRASMFLCVLATDSKVALEDINKKISCNTNLASYVRRKNKNDGMYLKRKFPEISNGVRKELIQNPYKIVSYMLFKDIVKDNNNLLKILNFPMTKSLLKNMLGFGFESHKFNGFSDIEKAISPYRVEFEHLKNLYSSETVFVNHALKYSMRDINAFLVDTLSILGRFYMNIESSQQDIKIKFNRKFSLKRIHDEVSSAFNKLSRENRTIKITEEEQKLSWNKNGYTFSPATDTHSLIDIGSELDICVGGYDNLAVSKACTIFKVEEGGKLVCCIELRPKTQYNPFLSRIDEYEVVESRFKICQAKCYSNSLSRGNLKSTILEWTKEHRIINATSDLS